ncbi:MAG: c-type cytochrome [bacterium]|nr:c-type cytochrome [bacterium]
MYLVVAVLLGACQAEAPPLNPIVIEVVAKQWAWKAQHIEGRQEINELHVPMGEPVELRMRSADVEHSLSIPAFGVRADVTPGEESATWFRPDRTGEFHLFCAKYCGAGFSQMRGTLIVMEPRAYQQWLSGVGPGESPLEVGRRLFAELKCDTCHRSDGAGRGPAIEGIFGRTVNLSDGSGAIADDAYVRESILDPNARRVSGFEPVMPAFTGRLSEEQLSGLLAYLRSLDAGGTP